MICRNCGTMNKEEAKFCECCGQDLNSPYINPTVVEEKPKTSNNVISMVMGILSIVLSVWGINISKIFRRKVVKIIYCVAAVLINTLLTIWVVNTFMWA